MRSTKERILYESPTSDGYKVCLSLPLRHSQSPCESHPDAELHVLAAVDFHSTIKASDLAKKTPISYNNPHDGGASEDKNFTNILEMKIAAVLQNTEAVHQFHLQDLIY